jgi:DNA-binding transcriptional ArsR family regulator
MDPMWEIVGSVQLLQLDRGRRPALFDSWVRRAQARMRHQATGNAAKVLATVAPLNNYFPDFLTPDIVSGRFDDDLHAVLSTPKARLGAEIGRLGTISAPWLKDLALGNPATLDRFGDVVRCYYRAIIEPDRGIIESALAAHRAALLRRMMRGGTEAVLDHLGPSMRWRAPYLECVYPVRREVDLAGRGLRLVPSYFCCRTPVMLADDELTPLLVCPVDHPQTEVEEPGIAELIGSTRAAVLGAVLDGASTSDVAHRVGISVATASHHTAVLRGAGLITSTRRANRVVHSASGLGLAMLGSDAAP